MPLFLQIALGIVGGVIGLILLFSGPRIFMAVADGVMQGNIFQMMSKGMMLISIPFLTVMIVKLFKGMSNPESINAVMTEPVSLMGMLALVLGAGFLFLGEKWENRAKKKAEAQTHT